MAALISFARYFPAEEEDRAKGKRTPVVRAGGARASRIFLAIGVLGAACFFLGWEALRPLPECVGGATPEWHIERVAIGAAALGAAASALAVGVLGAAFLPRAGRPSQAAVATSVIAHFAVSLLLAIALWGDGTFPLYCY
jgi:hypothetical protein